MQHSSNFTHNYRTRLFGGFIKSGVGLSMQFQRFFLSLLVFLCVTSPTLCSAEPIQSHTSNITQHPALKPTIEVQQLPHFLSDYNPIELITIAGVSMVAIVLGLRKLFGLSIEDTYQSEEQGKFTFFR